MTFVVRQSAEWRWEGEYKGLIGARTRRGGPAHWITLLISPLSIDRRVYTHPADSLSSTDPGKSPSTRLVLLVSSSLNCNCRENANTGSNRDKAQRIYPNVPFFSSLSLSADTEPAASPSTEPPTCPGVPASPAPVSSQRWIDDVRLCRQPRDTDRRVFMRARLFVHSGNSAMVAWCCRHCRLVPDRSAPLGVVQTRLLFRRD